MATRPEETRGRTKATRRAFAGVAAVVALGCGTAAAWPGGGGATHAAATIVDGTGQQVGTAKFTEDAKGRVHVNVHVEGLTPGLHGIHIHQVASCVGPTFGSAGTHHNPTGAAHGSESAQPNHPHSGDLPNLVVNANGVGHLSAKTALASLTDGPLSVFDANGSALVIHASPDDLQTDPTGNSGARIACGVIEG